MLTKCMKLIIGMCLLLGCVDLNRIATATDNSSEQLPRRIVVITVDTSQQDKLFEQLRKFAHKQGFTVQIETRPPSVEGYYVDMYRKDIEINGTNPFRLGEYKLGIYDADRQHPVSEAVLDDLMSDLKNFVSEVPNVTISEEK